jgi:manganese efflux pump family protein
MSLLTLFFLAIGLSADSFAVSVSCGLSKSKITFFQATKIAFSLAAFQATMPVLGWFFGNEVKEFMITWDHWIAFILLTALGTKMIAEVFPEKKEEKKFNPLDLKILLWISVATSIDALVVGVSIAFMDISGRQAFAGIFMIGFVTFIASMLGILFGKKTGIRFGKKVELAGGILLILIGIKILLEHFLFQP